MRIIPTALLTGLFLLPNWHVFAKVETTFALYNVNENRSVCFALTQNIRTLPTHMIRQCLAPGENYHDNIDITQPWYLLLFDSKVRSAFPFAVYHFTVGKKIWLVYNLERTIHFDGEYLRDIFVEGPPHKYYEPFLIPHPACVPEPVEKNGCIPWRRRVVKQEPSPYVMTEDIIDGISNLLKLERLQGLN